MRALLMLGLVGLASNGIKDCRKTPAPDAGATSEAIPALAPGAGPVTNEKVITRYPSERKSEEALQLARDVIARQSPPDGPTVANLAAGTNVEQMSVMADGILIVFAGAAGERLMGWVEPQAFSAPPAVVASSGRILVALPRVDSGTLLADAGKAAGDAGSSMKDAGSLLDSGAGAKVDAGAPSKVDAGATHKPDAGATHKPDAGAAHKPDAGAAHRPDAGAGAKP